MKINRYKCYRKDMTIVRTTHLDKLESYCGSLVEIIENMQKENIEVLERLDNLNSLVNSITKEDKNEQS